mgnify:CR=1 FL=1
MLGTVLTAMPISYFGIVGGSGIVVSTAIAIPLLIICLIADQSQIESMIGIFACAALGWFAGSLLPSMGLREFQLNSTSCAGVGCVLGLVWSESLYARKRQES